MSMNLTRHLVRSHRLFSTARRDAVNVGNIAARHGVRLTENEFAKLRTLVDANKDGIVSRSELVSAGRKVVEARASRDICLSVIDTPCSWLDRMVGVHALQVCDVGGTLLYAVAGTQVAGDAGMNIIGCTLIGCATALGGGTLNNLLYGMASPLHGNPGVFWVCDPSYLAMAMGASLLTFFLWPVYCQNQTNHYLKNVIGEKNLERDGSVSRRAFLSACEQDEEFLETMRAAIGKEGKIISSDRIFEIMDTNHSGTLDHEDLRRFTQQQFDNSFETYVLDSLALGSFAVAAVHGGIAAGTHPLVAMSAGVTICFGGIMRDVLCHRSIAIGAQSYAFATGSGAAVYVALRELSVRGFHTSLFTRIVFTLGTTIGLRAWEYHRGRPILAPMHGRPVFDLEE